VAYPHIAQVIALLERYFTIIDAVRCAMLIREEGNLDPIGEDTVSLSPCSPTRCLSDNSRIRAERAGITVTIEEKRLQNGQRQEK
jgi:hypothetical protein